MEPYIYANAVLSRFSRNYMALKQSLPIRPSEMAVLNILSVFPERHTPVMLAERLGVSKPMITALVTALNQKGYITKEPSRTDKRAYYVLMTPRAQALVQTAREDTDRQLAQLMEAMGQEEFDLLVKLTQRANQFLEEKEGENQ